MGIGIAGCCCSTCTVGTDTFTEANNSLVPGWTQVAGTSAIVSNKLKFTASNTMVVFNTTDSSGGVEVNASVQCVGANANDVIRLFVKSDGTTSNYWYAELIIGTSKTLRVFKVVSGSATQLATKTVTTSTGTTYTLSVCYGNGNFTASVVEISATIGANVTTNISTQLSAGLSCGTITSNVQFTNFTYSHGYNVTSNPTCDACAGPTGCNPVDTTTYPTCCAGLSYPSQMDITIPSGFSDNAICPGVCASIAGTYTATLTGAISSPSDLNGGFYLGPLVWTFVDPNFCVSSAVVPGLTVHLGVQFALICDSDGSPPFYCRTSIKVTLYSQPESPSDAFSCFWQWTDKNFNSVNCDTNVWNLPYSIQGAGGIAVCTSGSLPNATATKH